MPVVLLLLILAADVTRLILQQLNHSNTMAKLSQLDQILTEVNDTLEKARTEILDAVAKLRDQIAQQDDPDLSAQAQTQLDRLLAVSRSLDELNPDATAPIITEAQPPRMPNPPSNP